MSTTERQKRAKPLMPVSEAGHELGIGTTTAYEWLRRGELPGAVRLGGRWYVRRVVLEAFLAGADVLPPGAEGPTVLTSDRGRRATG